MSEGEAVRPSVIDRVWLCPVHAEEFWVPHGGICPSLGCDRELRVYWAADEVLEALRSDALYEFLHYDDKLAAGAEGAIPFLERRFSGEGAS